MPSQTRILPAGGRNVSWDHFIQDILDRDAWREENHYYGITDEERAAQVRRGLRQAGRHMNPNVAVHTYYYPCAGCKNGGPDCRFHVLYSVHTMEEARAYKAKIASAYKK